MSTKPNPLQVRADLVAAQASRTLVRVRRSVEEGWAAGWVVGVGPQLFALSVVSDSILFNGFQVFRIRDVSSVEVPSPHAAFIETALRLRGQIAPQDPPIDLSDLQSALTSASAAFPLVAVHQEIEDPDVCFIGTVQQIADGKLFLKTVSPDGQWDGEQETITVSDITRIDFGGLYEQALSLVAGPG